MLFAVIAAVVAVGVGDSLLDRAAVRSSKASAVASVFSTGLSSLSSGLEGSCRYLSDRALPIVSVCRCFTLLRLAFFSALQLVIRATLRRGSTASYRASLTMPRLPLISAPSARRTVSIVPLEGTISESSTLP
jgi:hypothetical protein